MRGNSLLLSMMPFYMYSNWGLLALRVGVGAIFLGHGPGKIKGAKGTMMWIGWAETIGAIAVLIGLLTPLAALGLGIIMLGAIWKKKMEWHVPFSASDKMGWEVDLLILCACIALITLGAGNASVDAMMGLG